MRRSTLSAAGAFAALSFSGCAGGGIAAPVDSPVTIVVSDAFLTVKNVGSLPLTDLTIGIEPTGVRPEYQTDVPRLAAGQELRIPYAEFLGIDRDSLNLQTIRPQLVHVTARNPNGEEYDIQLPWE